MTAAPTPSTTGNRLAGKVAIITGGGSGIGRSIAERFAAEGAQVAVLDLLPAAAAETNERITAAGGRGLALSVDVADGAGVAERVAQIVGRCGQVDILVNNAGVAAIGNVEACSAADFDRVQRINVTGAFNVLKSVVPLLKGRGGSIINLASVAALVGIPDRFAYSASKGALLAMTYSVATDYIRQGIRCNCIAPARIHTPFVDGFLAQHYAGREAEMFAALSATQPIGRMGQPDEVAHLAVYLASDESLFVTGTCFPIDGGFVRCKV